jgi:hypothetical protein
LERDVPTVRGNIIVLGKFYITERFSPELYKKIVAGTSPDTQKVLSGVLISHQFYDVNIYEELLAGLKKEVSSEEFMGISEYQAQKQLKGIYALLVRMLSLESITEKAAAMFDKDIPEGHLEVVSSEEKNIVLRVSKVKLPPLLRESLGWFIRHIIEAATRKKYRGEHIIKSETDTDYHYWPADAK